MSRIYWDTMMFVYLIEGNLEYAPRVRDIHRRIAERQDTICTSVFTVGELLAGPAKSGDSQLADVIQEALRHPVYEIQPFTRQTAELYAHIRGSARVKQADPIHLAKAAEARVTLFLTND